MSNELNNIISHQTNGVYEGVAIGGDRYPVSTFMDHLLRYQVRINFHLPGSCVISNPFGLSGIPRREDVSPAG